MDEGRTIAGFCWELAQAPHVGAGWEQQQPRREPATSQAHGVAAPPQGSRSTPPLALSPAWAVALAAMGLGVGEPT